MYELADRIVNHASAIDKRGGSDPHGKESALVILNKAWGGRVCVGS